MDGERAARELYRGLGRRGFLLASAGVATLGAAACSAPAAPPAPAPPPGAPGPPAGPGTAAPGPGGIPVLQPIVDGPPPHYVPATPDTVLWGRLPTRSTPPVTVVDSGTVIVVDTVSHEGLLEDQGGDPRAFFGGHGVDPDDVLTDAVTIAARVEQDGPGPHVVTGPIAVRGSEPGHTLAVDVVDLQLRVPYGVVSNRHGRGALPGELPEAWSGRPDLARWFNQGGEISVFTPARAGAEGLEGVMPAGAAEVAFPLGPFLGLMGVARPDDRLIDSVPPTDAGGNLDVKDLVVGSRLYLPVRVPGAMFFTGDPHMAQGDGEVALTAMEGSLRATLRLTTIPPDGPAPSGAFTFPFGETPTHWLPIGLSDADGPLGGGQETSLDVAMRDAVRRALAFLVTDRGMEPPVAYAYLSAAVDFHVTQVVDRTVGVHALIRKRDFG